MEMFINYIKTAKNKQYKDIIRILFSVKREKT